MNVADTSKAVRDLIADAILLQNADLPSDDQFVAYATDSWSHAEASLTGDSVHLTGNATSPAAKKLAGEAAADTVKRLHLSYPVANDLVLIKKPK